MKCSGIIRVNEHMITDSNHVAFASAPELCELCM